ncbi:GTPase ObgE [Candidatus Campbellbacteria bacterium CG10_big_fil_rev_8_21_14_0_10_35_52]|uniref:GTPase Obg n=1 Tax=Candidatus Campbellbacteria bacterium CG10_big_fil_rev_8_21_14_0_10_35_52 TaxID=1974527 RepID=A0A2M6WVI6_9BACT|nr:MAG: GTPase ObgE [Candidatus Campbellbacteria bacterium CG10_big_fil_rev_8_21_14_0_10_35_52]
MFIDELIIHIKAGKGGDGVVRWLHEKDKEFGGPSGGDGGRGGDVFAVSARNLNLLARYRNKKEFCAENAENGKNNNLHGASGRNLEILLPIGSIITNKQTGEKIYLNKEGEKILLLKGGNGGYGNEHFKSSINQRPKEFTKGKLGEEADFYIEVELIADVGLIGLPNSGKTSILNELANTRGKVGDYPFTTLEPNLGEYFGHIISDIPGLIKGAAEGKGLGHKFLRHIRRVKILAHLISLENEDLDEAYKIIRKELGRFDKELLDKKEIIVLTKTDLIKDEKTIEKIIKKMQKINPNIIALTIYDDNSVKKFKDFLHKFLVLCANTSITA